MSKPIFATPHLVPKSSLKEMVDTPIIQDKIGELNLSPDPWMDPSNPSLMLVLPTPICLFTYAKILPSLESLV